jgi:hypothetical protein
MKLRDTLADEDCPDASARMLAAMLRDPSLVANVRGKVLALDTGRGLLPLSLSSGTTGECYTNSLRSTYLDYAREELRRLHAPALKAIAPPLFAGLGALLAAAGSERAVFPGNWLLSTNLHPAWLAASIGDVTACLTAEFPDRALILRSLNPVHHGELIDRCLAAGYRLLPNRKIYLIDPARHDPRRHADFRKDLALLAACGYLIDSSAVLDPAEAVRLSNLYSQLYHGKYSRLNPDLTPAWILAAHRSGFLRITVLRRPADGLAVGVLGYIVQDGVMTTPLLGYDRTLAGGPSLYRLLTARLTLEAEAAGLKMHRSAGADEFKLLRGAERQIESCAIFTGHLPPGRRLAWHAFHVLVSAVAPLAFR